MIVIKDKKMKKKLKRVEENGKIKWILSDQPEIGTCRSCENISTKKEPAKKAEKEGEAK